MSVGRFDILSKIFVALEGIDDATSTPGGPYNMKVGKVETYLRGWDDSATFPRPWIGFRPTVETYEYSPTHLIRCTMGLQIVAHVSPGDSSGNLVDNQILDVEKIIDDILRALRQSVIRSGCAESITLKETDTTQGDASQFETASASMLFDVVYYRTERSD